MKCPSLSDLPVPLPGKTGWPWTEETSPLPFQRGQDVMWPKVTLVTPSFNQGRYLEEAIRSVLLQGYPDLEYFIMDGGSKDETVRIIRKYERWITGWVSEPDGGQSKAINKGLARATGKFFNWHNADDVLTKGSLAATSAAMMTNPGASGVTGYIVAVDENSHVLSVNDDHPLLKGKSGFLHDLTRCVSNLKVGCQPGSLMDRELAVKVGGIDNDLHYSMDVDIQLRLMLEKPFYHVDFPVTMFRLHPESKTNKMTGARATERLMIARKIFSAGNLSPQIARLKSLSFAQAHGAAAKNYRDWRSYGRAAYHSTLSFWCLCLYRLEGR